MHNTNKNYKYNKVIIKNNNVKNNTKLKMLQHYRSEETRVYGKNSCRALFKNRPKCIVRAWFTHSIVFHFKEILYWMARQHKAYHVVNHVELAKISGTKHHGGVCFLIKKRNGTTVQQWINQSYINDCILALENIGNPHNLGAIMRTCAHFNIRGVLINNISILESGSAVYTSEGGAEYVHPIVGNNIIESIKKLHKAGYSIITTSSHSGISLFKIKLPKKIVLVFGQETNGISNEIFSISDLKISISGTGNVESLNVSVATGIFLAEWWRQNRT